MSEPSDEFKQFDLYMGEKLREFEKLCQERYVEGARKYGDFSWMENDVVRMLLEELADTVNYCTMQAIKLLILQEKLEDEVTTKLGVDKEKEQDIQLGFKAFKGTKDVGWSK